MPENLNRTDKIALLAGAAAALALLACTALLFRHGFDFTDEGSYLLAMERPREYPTLPVLAFFFFQPLYLFLGKNVALLRAVWFGMTFLAALAASRSFVNAFFSRSERPPATAAWPLAAALAAAGPAAFLTLWLPTPNYNSLNFVGICLFASGLIDLMAAGNALQGKEASSDAPPGSPAGGAVRAVAPRLMMAFGVWLSFLGRPFTAPALMLVALLAAARAGLARSLIMPAAVAAGLLLASAYWTDGSLWALSERFLSASRELGQYGTHDSLKLLNLDPGAAWRFLGGPFAPLFFCLFLWGFALGPAGSAAPGASRFGTLAILAPPAALALLVFTPFPFSLFGWPKAVAGHHLWAAPCGAFVRALLPSARTKAPRPPLNPPDPPGEPELQEPPVRPDTPDSRAPKAPLDFPVSPASPDVPPAPPPKRPGAFCAPALFAAALAYALGSNNPLVTATSAASFFIALGFMALLSRAAPGRS
ncbi:MAG: hypothetical protein LBQ12_09865, partial [Deltaproteobacteria bacterium]|nr:hypothetical protein [Deltaproteobacteria bacterium]